jgi:hypothetical protein
MRIDTVMCSREEYTKNFVTTCEILGYGTSDHSGIWTTLDTQLQPAVGPAQQTAAASQQDSTRPMKDYGDILSPMIFDKLLDAL